MQNSAPSRRRYPRARSDLRFQSVGGILAVARADQASRPVEFADALVLTYCDGRHDAGAIAVAVAGSLAPGRTTDLLQEDVRRILDRLYQEGYLH
ncbi:MAG: hypothetical protein ACREOC_16905 [Gemmatimonadales bacterium]